VSNRLPSVTSDIPRDLRTFVDRIREILTGTGNDRLVSAQDLIDSGLASAGNNGTLTVPTTTGVIGTPPAPTNLSVTAGVNDLFVEWDDPVYFGHDYTEVFSGATNVIGDAVLLGFTPGVNYVDTIGPQLSRYYWARFVNRLGVKGPFNSVTGTLGTTLPEVDHLLNVLTGEITETQLFTDLGSRIDLVDTTNGGLTNKYTVKIDSNGYVSGFGLAYTANNAAPFSDFIIRADRFSIASPSGPGLTPIVPFIVTTTQSTIDGTVVPAGVYIDGAYIKGGTIQGSAILGGTITNSKLINVSANKITGAALEATSFIESAAYISGSQGWKIHANGTAEFAAASIRGQLTAGQIDTRNLTIKDASGNVLFGAGTNIAYGTITGTPTLGALASQNTVAYSSVTGTPTLGALAAANSVNWNTQITNIPGFGGFAFLNTITDANISTYIAGAAIGTAYIANAAITGAKILDGEITNAKIGGAIQSTNFSTGSAGWSINKTGSAEFNDITVRSGQIIGVLLAAVKISSYSGLFVETSVGNPISTTNGPYYLNGAGEPLYLVFNASMPAPATAAHRIAIILNVQAIAGSTSKDLGVQLFVNSFFTGGDSFTASELIAYNTVSGAFGIATNSAGVSANTYATSTPCMVFVTGYNAAYTVQTIDGLAWGVR